jgi:hypothetical protein
VTNCKKCDRPFLAVVLEVPAAGAAYLPTAEAVHFSTSNAVHLPTENAVHLGKSQGELLHWAVT